MANLAILKQGVKSGNVKEESLSFLKAFNGNAKILSIDNYIDGVDWKRERKEPIIVIYDGKNAPNEEVVFEGTQSQLVELLLKNRR